MTRVDPENYLKDPKNFLIIKPLFARAPKNGLFWEREIIKFSKSTFFLLSRTEN